MSEEKRGRGRPPGPTLRALLTKTFRAGATAEQLIAAGYKGEFKGDVAIDEDGVFHWTGELPESPPPQKVEPEIDVDNLQFHPLAEIFPMMTPAELNALVDIKLHGLHDPIEVYDGMILEGRNRFVGCKFAGVAPQFAHVDFPDEATMRAYVISKNLHRRHLTQEQKRTIIATLLQDNPEQSDRAIAAMAHVHHETVAAEREKLESTDGIRQLEKRIGRDGKARALPNTTKQDVQKAAGALFHQAADLACMFGATTPTIVPTDDNKVVPIAHEEVSMRIPRKPQSAAAAIIRNLSRDDIRELIRALQAFFDAPVPQWGHNSNPPRTHKHGDGTKAPAAARGVTYQTVV